MSDSYLLVFTTLDRIYFYYAFNYIFARQLWLLVTVPVLQRHSTIQLTAIDLVIVEALLHACCDC